MTGGWRDGSAIKDKVQAHNEINERGFHYDERK